MYLIQRIDGALVADMKKSKTGSSYTTDIRQAVHYTTRERAENQLCPENERIITLDEYLRG